MSTACPSCSSSICTPPLTGCGTPLLRSTTAVLAGGAGAVGGTLLSKGRPEFAAGGAMLGVAASELIHHQKTRAEQKAFRAGYEQGLGEQARTEYWRLQQQHLPAPSPILRLAVPQPEQFTSDGVRLHPTTQFIEIHQ